MAAHVDHISRLSVLDFSAIFRDFSLLLVTWGDGCEFDNKPSHKALMTNNISKVVDGLT